MIVHLAFHHPKAGAEDALVDSMRRFDAAAGDASGKRLHAILRNPDDGSLVGLSVWDSREALDAARPAMRAAVADDPFGEWWERPPDVFVLDEVQRPDRSAEDREG